MYFFEFHNCIIQLTHNYDHSAFNLHTTDVNKHSEIKVSGNEHFLVQSLQTCRVLWTCLIQDRIAQIIAQQGNESKLSECDGPLDASKNDDDNAGDQLQPSSTDSATTTTAITNTNDSATITNTKDSATITNTKDTNDKTDDQ